MASLLFVACFLFFRWFEFWWRWTCLSYISEWLRTWCFVWLPVCFFLSFFIFLLRRDDDDDDDDNGDDDDDGWFNFATSRSFFFISFQYSINVPFMAKVFHELYTFFFFIKTIKMVFLFSSSHYVCLSFDFRRTYCFIFLSGLVLIIFYWNLHFVHCTNSLNLISAFVEVALMLLFVTAG